MRPPPRLLPETSTWISLVCVPGHRRMPLSVHALEIYATAAFFPVPITRRIGPVTAANLSRPFFVR